MILYHTDWTLYPTARPDTTTKNESFLHMARTYRDMGVRNHLFPLALINQELRDIDPFSLSLSPLEMSLVATECKINPWYYFREVARAPGLSGGQARQVEANRGNIALWWCYFNHITTFLIMIRQTGKSFSVDLLDVLLLNVMCTDTHINLLTKDDGLRSRNLERIRDIEAELPFYLRAKTKTDISNSEEILYKTLNNGYRGHLPQKQAKMANNAARGFTSANFRIDEGPFQPNIEIALPAALPAGNRAREEAKLNGAPYGTILTTTAGKKNEKEGAFFYKLVSNAAPWAEAFLDSRDHAQLEETIIANSRGDKDNVDARVNITMNHRQLGKDDAWLKRAISESMAKEGDPENMKRDFFNIWTSGTSSNPLSPAQLKIIADSEREPDFVEIAPIGNYILNWFIPEKSIGYRMNETKYIATIDTSDASGGDDISLRIQDIRNGETIATGSYNTTNVITWVEWVAWLMVRFPNLIILPERRSTGSSVIDYLLLVLPSKGIDPFTRIFNRVVQERDEDREAYKEISQPLGRRSSDIYIRHKKAFGFATSSTGTYARSELFGGIIAAAREFGHLIKDKLTIEQVSELVRINGRIDHPPGGHDDMVIGWLLFHWFVTKGRNLTHYGIDVTHILREVRKAEAPTPQVAWQNNEQQQLRARITEIGERLGKEQNEFIVEKLEGEIKSLAMRVKSTDSVKFSVEELITNLREERKKSKNPIYRDRRNIYDRADRMKAAESRYRDPTRFYIEDYT